MQPGFQRAAHDAAKPGGETDLRFIDRCERIDDENRSEDDGCDEIAALQKTPPSYVGVSNRSRGVPCG